MDDFVLMSKLTVIQISNIRFYNFSAEHRVNLHEKFRK